MRGAPHDAAVGGGACLRPRSPRKPREGSAEQSAKGMPVPTHSSPVSSLRVAAPRGQCKTRAKAKSLDATPSPSAWNPPTEAHATRHGAAQERGRRGCPSRSRTSTPNTASRSSRSSRRSAEPRSVGCAGRGSRSPRPSALRVAGCVPATTLVRPAPNSPRNRAGSQPQPPLARQFQVPLGGFTAALHWTLATWRGRCPRPAPGAYRPVRIPNA